VRRPSPRIRTCLFVLTSVAIAPGAQADDAARAVRFDVRTMGTVGAVTVITPDSASVAAIAERALGAFGAVDARLSNWNPHSELSAVNAGLDVGPVELSAEAAVVITAALRIARESDGAFDPTVEPLVRLWGFLGGTPRVPDRTAIESARTRTGYGYLRLAGDPLTLVADRSGMRIDLGGIAKGHAVDLAHAILREAGIEHALVDLSGNMRALGHPPGRASWTLGVRDPDRRDGWFARLRLYDDAVATSGNYEQFVDADGHRYGHVLDPRSGWPVEGLDGVTVLAPTALLADAWATALLVQGPERARVTAAERGDLHVVLVQSASSGVRIVWVESSLAGRFDLVPDAAGRFEVRWF
jgi:FAD:protein FMN transferase